jgi:hypothetical protein
MTNKLYYGDNLDVLRASVASESVDLVYLDPPFNSNASYNVLFKATSGAQSPAQIEAFDDTWHWNESAERAFDEVLTGGHSDAAIMLKAMRSALGENDMMAYLAMTAVRLIEPHLVLKDADAARDLAERDKRGFQKWVVLTIRGQLNKGGKKGMDRGVDGYLHFRDAEKKPQLAVISVKGGATNSAHIRDLKGTMEREARRLESSSP